MCLHYVSVSMWKTLSRHCKAKRCLNGRWAGHADQMGYSRDKKTFAPCYSQTPPPAVYSAMVFLDLRFLHSYSCQGWGLGFVYIISWFIFESSIVLSLIARYTYFPIEALIISAAKGGKPERKPYHPYGFKNLYNTFNQ
jgi:hypothetical protein